jgi:hypothetical protein
MSEKKKVVEVIPSPKRLIRALGELGYDFSTAVAELIDNSIAAGATSIHVYAFFEGDDSWVMVADNGIGMNAGQLIEGMRLGSERQEKDEDLGKFGLGLKTASFSQCDLVTVISRKNPNRNEIVAYCWDLDHINKRDKWEIIELTRKDIDSRFSDPLNENTGTIVIWQKLDKMLGYQHPFGEIVRKRMNALCRDLEEHLAMVFQRFIDGEVRRHKLKIFLNGNEIKAWDPFARQERKTIHRNPIRIPIDYEGVHGSVTLEPYILPHADDFSSHESWEKASGPRKWNQQQGLYIYRENRLIQSGGWSKLRTSDEHTKLARIALNFSKNLDEAFKINVPKMRVQIPSQIRGQIVEEVQKVVKIAQEKYRRPDSRPPVPPIPIPPLPPVGPTPPLPPVGPTPPLPPVGPTPPLPPVYPPTDRGFTQEDPESHPTEGKLTVWMLDEVERQLTKTAKPDERIVINTLFKRLRLALIKENRS